MSDGSVSGVTEDAATRLGRLIRERRRALKMTQADVQAAGGPSTATLRLIEGGKHTDFRPGTIQPLETVLQWQPGSIAVILDGFDPIPVFQEEDEIQMAARNKDALAHLNAELVVANSNQDEVAVRDLQRQIDMRTAEQVVLRGVEMRRAEANEQAFWIALSFLADEVDGAVPFTAPDPADTDEVESYISDVESLVSAAEELTDAVHKAVADAFHGDIAKLRQKKRLIQRTNRAKYERLHGSILDEGDPPPPTLAHAARSGDSAGQALRDAQDRAAEQGDAETDGSQIDVHEE
jgi:transcriptional regulator with XRE-family HTH domain